MVYTSELSLLYHVLIQYDFCSEELSHMLYAAADMVLVPSIYEPCGLAQMIGMRYGAVLFISHLSFFSFAGNY